MPSPQQFLKLFNGFLKTSPGFSSIPSSLLLIGLEELMERHLSCPCTHAVNIILIISIFIGPFLFMFALMFILLRPCKYKCCPCGAKKNKDDHQITPNASKAGNDQKNAPIASDDKDDQQIAPDASAAGKDQKNAPNANDNKDDQQDFWKALGHCLIPPIFWIIILFLDGDHLACGATKWEGNFVFDKELDRKWCQPIEQANARNQSDLRRTYQEYINISKAVGYVVLAVFGILIVVTVGIYDCSTSKTSGCCDVENSGCCKSENSGCGWSKIFASCKTPSTCCKGADAGTGAVNKSELLKLKSIGETGTTAEEVIEECDSS
nr:uncharacterized protein LOC129452607 [Misgurnus anguillicaudatus]